MVPMEGCFEELYLAHFDQIQSYISSLVNDSRATVDICADAYVRAAQSYQFIKSRITDFESWILSIAQTCATEYRPASAPVLSLESLPEDVILCVEDSEASQATADYADSLLDSLSRNERKLVYMRYFEEKRNVQIAHELGMNQSTVASGLQRALIKMRSCAAQKAS